MNLAAGHMSVNAGGRRLFFGGADGHLERGNEAYLIIHILRRTGIHADAKMFR